MRLNTMIVLAGAVISIGVVTGIVIYSDNKTAHNVGHKLALQLEHEITHYLKLGTASVISQAKRG